MRTRKSASSHAFQIEGLESRTLLSTTYLSDSHWNAGGFNGWGDIEFDQSNGESAPRDGKPITLNGQIYPKGLGVHATMDASWSIAASQGYTNFRADVGVDDEVGNNGSVVFQVWFDNEKLFDSGVMTGTSATRSVDVNIANRTGQIRLLVTDAGNGNTFDHADWAAARFVGADSQPVDSPTVAFASHTATPPSETGDAETVIISRTAGSSDGALTVNFATSGTAARGSDYELRTMENALISGSTFTIPADAQSYSFKIVGLQDMLVDPSETVTITLNAGSGYTVGSPNTETAFISDDEQTAEGVQYLSDRFIISSTNGWGPVELDRSNGEQPQGDGRAITLNGQIFQKGLGVHASSELVYSNLQGRYSSFQSVIGVDDEVGINGSVVFQVYGDDVKLYDSGKMTGSDAGKAISVDLTGVETLRLVVNDAGDGNGFDHADWGDARLIEISDGAPYLVHMTSKTVFEGARDRIVFEVNGDGTGPESLEFDYETYDISAKAGEDYTPESGHIVVPPDSGVRQFPVFIQTIDDGLAEPTETFGVRIFNIVGNVQIEPGGGIMTIQGQQQAVSALTPTSQSNGWGPYEKDKSNGEAAAGDGKSITLQGITYESGLGVHANSDLTFDIANRGFTKFISAIGVDDEVGSNGSVVFQVFVDGVKRFDSGVMTGSSATKDVEVDVTDASTLRLVVTDAGNGNTFDHADWANAYLG
jgi:hypothetical protein